MTGDLIAGLLAAIAETEQEAHDAITRPGSDEWGLEVDPRGDSWWEDSWDPSVIAGGKPIVRCNEEYGGRSVAAHIVRHDPAAVLRRCEADRSVLGLCRHAMSLDASGPATLARLVLHELAAGYGITEP